MAAVLLEDKQGTHQISRLTDSVRRHCIVVCAEIDECHGLFTTTWTHGCHQAKETQRN